MSSSSTLMQLLSPTEVITVEAFTDQTVSEVYINHGRATFSGQSMGGGPLGVSAFSAAGSTKLLNFSVWSVDASRFGKSATLKSDDDNAYVMHSHICVKDSKNRLPLQVAAENGHSLDLI